MDDRDGYLAMTLFDYLIEYSKIEDGKIALMDASKRMTYRELYFVLMHNQSLIRTLHIVSGDIICLKFTDPIKFIISFLSYAVCGCLVLPLPANTTLEEDEEILRMIDVKQVVEETTCLLKYEASDIGNSRNMLSIPDGNLPILYHLTSGSTGGKKICVRTLDALTSEGNSYSKCFSIDRSDTILAAPPVWHSYTLGAGLCAALVAGAALNVLGKFSPRKVIKEIDASQATVLLLVPTMAKLIAKTESKDSNKLDSLKWTIVGTGNVDSETAQTLVEKYNMHLSINYGSTETGGVISRINNKPFDTIGKPMENVEIIIKPYEGSVFNNDSVGQLWIKAKSMMTNYHDSGCHFDESGYMYTGDLASVDEFGNVYIHGREKRFLKIGGKSINPVEVESALLKHENILDCYVYSDDRQSREMIEAMIVSKAELDQIEVFRHCRAYLNKDQIPGKIHMCSEIPRNELGKIDFNKIQQQS